MLEQKLIDILRSNEYLLRDLELVRQLGLPDWYIAAGYVRNRVWDHLHGYSEPTPLNDVDILYYDPYDLAEDTEKRHELVLREQRNTYDWSCKNQARMHIRNQDEPYLSVTDAMKRWPETATAVGVSLDEDGGIIIIAPYGLQDLFDLVIRKSPLYTDDDVFHQRIQSKNWLEKWPLLKIREKS
ncbi:nucleotidyltransferase family protein [Paenibacillus senegalimassiliensis]|uniref:nucleotidyltransferase family protein n=1 Tax=Paenibacillus senegalimassiliensis TaxID=1737426 RepID=UPI00073F2A08|nr:nucleotidyltransferase family protein [Paenibacillus senegalimassiliensis]